ncbi:MAG: aspartate aminotransferase family protein [Planctomycetes bacterium]|nr:aspartate aminotransferase family protein [Planctomycetota bacterium]
MSTPAQQRKLIAEAYDPRLVREAGKRMAELLAEHFSSVQSGEGPVLNWEEPSLNLKLARAEIDAGQIDRERASPAQGFDSLVTRFDALLKQSLARGQNLHHPHYVGHQVPASIPLAGLFDAATTLTNQVMAIYEMGPWATAIEQAVVGALGEAIGFTAGKFGGLITSGGSLANLTALLTARNVALGDVWSTGIAARSPAPVLVTHAEAHYCVTRAAGILGLGTEQVVRVPIDGRRRMDANQLDSILSDLRIRGVPIVAVAAAACTTPIGAFDPLVEIADVCRRHEVWLHVDAAHGGAACLSAKHRHLVRGLELADSVVCDAHKMMFMPALCAMVFYRDREHRFSAFEQTAPYLFDPSAPGMAEYDNGMVNMECTKRAAAMGLWGVWSTFGNRLFEALVDTTFDLAQRFYEILDEADDFQPFCRPECNIVVFRYLPAEIRDRPAEEIDRFQLQLRRAVVESGDFYLVQARWPKLLARDDDESTNNRRTSARVASPLAASHVEGGNSGDLSDRGYCCPPRGYCDNVRKYRTALPMSSTGCRESRRSIVSQSRYSNSSSMPKSSGKSAVPRPNSTSTP